MEHSEKKNPEKKVYVIAGRRFTHLPISWAQAERLGQTVFKDTDLKAMQAQELTILIQRHAPLLLAICLLDDGQSRADKGQQAWGEVLELEAWLKRNAEPAELRGPAHDFFDVNPPANLWTLIDYATSMTAAASGSVMPSGSMPASASSPEAILHGASTS